MRRALTTGAAIVAAAAVAATLAWSVGLKETVDQAVNPAPAATAIARPDSAGGGEVELDPDATTAPPIEPITPAQPGPAVVAPPAAPGADSVAADIAAGSSAAAFGLFAPDAPPNMDSLAAPIASAACRPRYVEWFAQINDPLPAANLSAVADAGATSILTLEPWGGAGRDPYSLRQTYNGSLDDRYTAIARTVADFEAPVLVRFAHEMNGAWYPWSESFGPNSRGEYVRAWRHVHDVFAAAGATNVVWTWSPNVLRGASSDLASLYPGDDYVNLVGLTGYGVAGEKSVSTTYDPTVNALRAITDKPIMLTETGVEPSADKAAWIASLGPWLAANQDVVGFVWWAQDRAGGANTNWNYDDSSSNAQAFRNTLAAAKTQCG